MWKRSSKIALTISVPLFVAIASFFLWRSVVAHDFSSAQLISLLRSHFAAGAVLCIALEFLQVVFPPIPGAAVEFAIGFVFGPWVGSAYGILGVALGSLSSFGFARVVGRPVIERFVGARRLTKVDALLTSARGKAGLFTIFLLPNTPKDVLCYAAGLSQIEFVPFAILASVGRAPSVLLGVLLGTAVHARDYEALLLICGIALIAVAAYLVRGRLATMSRQEYMPISIRPAPVLVRTRPSVRGTRGEEA